MLNLKISEIKYKRLIQIERRILFMSNTAESKLYTYADYVNYPENERIEIIDGHIYAMSPNPSRIHQEIIMVVVRYILLPLM